MHARKIALVGLHDQARPIGIGQAICPGLQSLGKTPVSKSLIEKETPAQVLFYKSGEIL